MTAKHPNPQKQLEPEPEPERFTQRLNIEVYCRRCESHISLGEAVIDGTTSGEQWDYLEKALITHGWASVRDPMNNRAALCPACFATVAGPAPEIIEAFDVSDICPMCGEHEKTIRYCEGRISFCPVLVKIGHLHRKCSVCGYEQLKRTKNASTR